jgi:hypothetical protein
VALTADDNLSTSGYKASVSSLLTGNNGYRAFDATGATSYWHSQYPYYTFVTGTYNPGQSALGTGTPANGTTLPTTELISGHQGEWIKLQMPKKIKLEEVRVYASHRVAAGINVYQMPKDIAIAGSNDGTNWYLVDSGTLRTGIRESYGMASLSVTTSSYYSYLALIVKTTDNQGANYSAIEIANIEYYGREEGSGSLDTTLKTVFNVPATTGTQLEVYYDAKNYTSGTVTDESPNSYVGTLNGNTQLETVDGIKAFTFDGNGDTITGTVSGASGEYVHSIVFWVKFEDLVATGNQGYTLFEMGPRAQDEMIGLYAESDMINYYFYSNDNSYVLNGVSFGSLVNNQWYQIAATYSGGSDISNRKIYINGNEIARTTHGGASSGPLSLTNGNFTIGDISGGGGSNDFKGSIANFRLYSKALNPDQVKELYDFQKDYFLGSKSQVTLYKGHLGVGVTEPSGQLELAGDERIQEYPPMAMTGWETYMEGHGVFRAGKSGHDAYLGTWDRWKVFNKGFTASGGTTGDAYHGEQSYSSSTGLYTGSESLGGISGDYFILDMPYKISLKHINVTSANQNRSPTEFIILGSNNGSTWTQIKSFSSSFTSAGQTLPFQVNSTEYFSYFGLVVTKIVASDGYFMLSEWQLFGTPDSTTLDKGSLTLGRSLDVPRVSRYDVDTETPRPEKLDVEFDTTVNSSPTDISGKGNHGTFNGASYVAADKAFLFDGSTDRIDATHTLGTGNLVFSESVWVKFDSPLSSSTGKFVGLGSVTGSTYNGHMLSVAGDGKLYVDNYASYCNTPSGTIEANRWYHIVYARTAGSANSPTNNHIYVNGVKIDMSGTQSANQGDLNIQDFDSDAYTANYIHVGGNPNGYFKGKISNYKLYSVCLEPSEIKKLYRLGRTGRSMVISDTAVGIGKVPEAQLDIRGNLKLNGLVMPHIIAGSWGMTGGNPSTTTIYMNEGNCIQSISNQNVAGQGNGISGNRGRITAPVTGLYNISFNFVSGTRNSSSYLGSYSASGGAILTSPMGSYREMFDMRSTDNVQESYAYTMCAKMDAGDKVKFSTYSSSYVDSSAFIVGSVHLIYAIPRATW